MQRGHATPDYFFCIIRANNILTSTAYGWRWPITERWLLGDTWTLPAQCCWWGVVFSEKAFQHSDTQQLFNLYRGKLLFLAQSSIVCCAFSWPNSDWLWACARQFHVSLELRAKPCKNRCCCIFILPIYGFFVAFGGHGFILGHSHTTNGDP